MGKYTAAMNAAGLKRLKTAEDPEEDPAQQDPRYQDKVNAAKEEVRDHLGTKTPTGSQLASLFRDTRKKKDELKAQLKAVQLYLTAVEQLLDERYEAEGVRSLTLIDDASQIRIDDEPHAKVNRGIIELEGPGGGKILTTGKDQLLEWCIANDLKNKLTLPWQSLNSLCKELLLRGQSPPPGVDLFVRPKFVWVRGKQQPQFTLSDL